jgi:hypothetical protein
VSKQVFYEPQRYHAILFQDFYTLITGKDDYRDDLAARQKDAAKRDRKKDKKKPDRGQDQASPSKDDALNLAQQLNVPQDDSEDDSDIMAFS